MNSENQVPEQLQPETSSTNQEKKMLKITAEIKSQLNEAGKWGKFLAILGFVFMGLMLLIGFIMSIVMAFIPRQEFGMMPFPPFLIGFLYLLIAALYLLPILYLYRFSTKIRQATRFNDQDQFSKAILNLKAHYRFIGILMIVFIAFYILMIIIMMFAGFFGAISSFGAMQA